MDERYDSLGAALTGGVAPISVTASLKLLDIPYISFTGEERIGQLVIRAELAEEVQDIYKALHERQFPIYKMVPIAAYGWDDEASMLDNNTSAFNYRLIIGTDLLSNHSYGTAIDINPMQNPYHARDGRIYPEAATYDPSARGTITADSIVVKLFKERGWRWLGEREENPDYQHFDKLG